MTPYVAADLGSANFRLSTEAGTVLSYPAVIAASPETFQITAIGEQAVPLIGKTPAGISTVYPIAAGRVADYDFALLLLRELFSRAGLVHGLTRPYIVAALPVGATNEEREAVEDLLCDAGAKAVKLVPSPLAAVLGKDSAPAENIRFGTRLCVDIGAGKTEISLLSEGNVLSSLYTEIAGNAFDEAIVRYIAATRNMQIGKEGAKLAKLRVGGASPEARQSQQAEIKITGRALSRGLCLPVPIDTETVSEALAPALGEIVTRIRSVCKTLSPDLAQAVADGGITLCGGSAELPGLPRYLANETGIKVTPVPLPGEAVIRGIRKAIQEELI